MLPSDAVLSETSFYPVNTSITRTHRLAAIGQASLRSIFFVIASKSIHARTFHIFYRHSHVRHCLVLRFRWQRTGHTYPNTHARTVARRRLARLCAFATLNTAKEATIETVFLTDTTTKRLVVPHRIDIERISATTEPQTQPPGHSVVRPNDHNALNPPPQTLRPSHSPSPSLPRHRRRTHLRAPRRPRRQVHGATIGLLPKPARFSGTAEKSARRSGYSGRHVHAV